MDSLHYLEAAKIAKDLRYANFNCSIEFEKTDLSYSIKQALKSKASYCIIIGDDEVSQNSVMIKNLNKRTQELIKNNNIISYFKNEFK